MEGLQLLTDTAIRQLCCDLYVPTPMISPFYDYRPKVSGEISYGLTSFGYDIRLSTSFRRPKRFGAGAYPILDPKDDRLADHIESFHCYDKIVMPPHTFILGMSTEYFRIPNTMLAIGIGKSTYARCGIITNVTPLEPGWEGFLTIEISNTADYPAAIYPQEGICQILFFQSNTRPEKTYSDKAGKYQNQLDVTLAKVS